MPVVGVRGREGIDRGVIRTHRCHGSFFGKHRHLGPEGVFSNHPFCVEGLQTANLEEEGLARSIGQRNVDAECLTPLTEPAWLN